MKHYNFGKCRQICIKLIYARMLTTECQKSLQSKLKVIQYTMAATKIFFEGYNYT